MDWRAKVELFEQIRREYEFGIGTIQGVAKKFGVHRRLVRQALENAMPPQRKKRVWQQPKIAAIEDFVERILQADLKAPRKQRHTAHRIYVRLGEEMADVKIAESTVRHYVAAHKQALGLSCHEVYIPQTYQWGVEAQVDWYEAYIDFEEERRKVEVFAMRSMASGAAFHRAYARATQQAFFEAHEAAFHYFGGVFKLLRYDNLKPAVKKVLRGHTREENARFIAFRSHWRFAAEFCNPKRGNEKGGVEGEGGYFRRNHMVPLPQAKDLADLNEQLLAACRQDQQRRIGERKQSVGVGMLIEQESLLPLSSEGFDLAEISFPTVDHKRCVRVRNNWYSVPVKPGTCVTARVLPATIELWHEGNQIACHERCYERDRYILNLEHYLDVLGYKPGAFAGSKPLEQWRQAGRWPESFDIFWQRLQQRYGKHPGTKKMIELIQIAPECGWPRLREAIEKALAIGCTDPAAVRHLIMAETLTHAPAEIIDIGLLQKYERPLPTMSYYDQLLEVVND